jgi:hypothetical protein
MPRILFSGIKKLAHGKFKNEQESYAPQSAAP